MILLATNKRDITTDFVVLELQRRSIPFVRLNTEDIAACRVALRPATGGWSVVVGDVEVDLSTVTGAYYRRPAAPEVGDDPEDPTVRPYRVAEWSAVLRSIWNELEGRWLNSPFAILRAEDKPRQLKLAAAVGFHIPETVVTNDPEAAVAFSRQADCIVKPLKHALLEDDGPGRVIFTNRMGPLVDEDADAVRLAPFIMQREVRKAHDVRAIVVGDRVFATAIHSQGNADTEVDWRRGSDPTLPHEPIELDDATRERCLAITRELGLRFGAIDLVTDVDGESWFLEINPNGQWAWIENRTGVRIAQAIVDDLCR